MTIGITCAAVGFVLALSSVAVLAMTAEPASGDGAVLELESLREVRVLDLVDQEDDGFSMSGLQPENIHAADATGRDLTGIEPGFMGVNANM